MVAAPDTPLGAVAWGLLAAGLAWSSWAGVALRRAGNALWPGAVPRRLVDDGPYRFGRHPMYLGGTLALGGAALLMAQPLLAAGAGVAAVVAHWLVIPAEEARLRRRFGGWYSDYMSDVRRWL